ncbi:MAG: hypothetical protein ACK4OM_00180 [Alphaproteobacteria bacterium]
MISYSITIPKNGTIVIPKEIRDIISTENIVLQVDENKNISIIPIKNLEGRFEKYKKTISPNIDETELAWKIHLNNNFQNKL